MIKLVLVRHGQSIWNLENRFTGWTDVELSENGIKEAKEAGIVLKQKGFTFDIAFTSVLKRANDTLNYILEELDLKDIPINYSYKLNERHYGALQGLNKDETRKKYGENTIDKSNAKIMGMTQEDYNNFKQLEKEIIDTLNLAMDEGDSKGKLAMKACELHKKWLSYTWNFYSKEAHRNLGEMYTQDERFKKYYDDNRKGMAEFLRDALIEFTNK